MVRLRAEKDTDPQPCSKKKGGRGDSTGSTSEKTPSTTIKEGFKTETEMVSKRSLRTLASKPDLSGKSVDFRKYPLMGKKIIVRGRRHLKGRPKGQNGAANENKPVPAGDSSNVIQSTTNLTTSNVSQNSEPGGYSYKFSFHQAKPEARGESSGQPGDGSPGSPQWRIPACILEIVPEQPPRVRKIRKEKWKIRPPGATGSTNLEKKDTLKIDTQKSTNFDTDSSSPPSSISSFHSSDADDSTGQTFQSDQKPKIDAHENNKDARKERLPFSKSSMSPSNISLSSLHSNMSSSHQSILSSLHPNIISPPLHDNVSSSHETSNDDKLVTIKQEEVEDVKPRVVPHFEANTLLVLMKDRMLNGMINDTKPKIFDRDVEHSSEHVSSPDESCSNPLEVVDSSQSDLLASASQVPHQLQPERSTSQQLKYLTSRKQSLSPLKTGSGGRPRGCTILETTPVLRGCVRDEMLEAGQRDLLYKNLRVSLSQPCDLNLKEEDKNNSEHHIQQIELYATKAVGKRRQTKRKTNTKYKGKAAYDDDDRQDDSHAVTGIRSGHGTDLNIPHTRRASEFTTPKKKVKNGDILESRRRSGTSRNSSSSGRSLRRRNHEQRYNEDLHEEEEEDIDHDQFQGPSRRRLGHSRKELANRKPCIHRKSVNLEERDGGARKRVRRAISFSEEGGDSSSEPAFLSCDEDSFSCRLPGVQEVSGQFSPTTLKWNATHTINKQGVYCYCGEPGDWFRSMVRCVRCSQWFHERCLQPRPRSMPIVQGDTFYLFVCSVCNYGVECLKRLPLSWENFVHVALFDLSLQHQKRNLHLMRDIYPALINNCGLYQVPKFIHSHPDKQEEILNVLKFSDKFINNGENEWGLKQLLPPPIPNFSLRYNGVVSERNVLDDAIRCSDIQYKQPVQINKYSYTNTDANNAPLPEDLRKQGSRQGPGEARGGREGTRDLVGEEERGVGMAQVRRGKILIRGSSSSSSSSPTRSIPGSSISSCQDSSSSRQHVSKESSQSSKPARSRATKLSSSRLISNTRTAAVKSATLKNGTKNCAPLQQENARKARAKSLSNEESRGSMMARSPPPPCEVPLEVVRPLPLDLSHQLILKGFPRVCVKFASIVPSRKTEVESILEATCSNDDKKKKRKRKRRTQTNSDLDGPGCKKQKLEPDLQNVAPGSGSGSGQSTPKSGAGGHHQQQPAGPGIKAATSVGSSVKFEGGGRVLDNLIPVRASYSGENNPFQLGCTETLRRARSMLCNRKLEWSDLTKSRSRLRKRKNPLSIEASRRIWRQGGGGDLGGPEVKVKSEGQPGAGEPQPTAGYDSCNGIQGQDGPRFLNNNYKTANKSVIKLTGSQKRKSASLGFKIDPATLDLLDKQVNQLDHKSNSQIGNHAGNDQTGLQNGSPVGLQNGDQVCPQNMNKSNNKAVVKSGHKGHVEAGNMVHNVRRVTRGLTALNSEVDKASLARVTRGQAAQSAQQNKVREKERRKPVTRGQSEVTEGQTKVDSEGHAKEVTRNHTAEVTQGHGNSFRGKKQASKISPPTNDLLQGGRSRGEAGASRRSVTLMKRRGHVVTAMFRGQAGELRVFMQKMHNKEERLTEM